MVAFPPLAENCLLGYSTTFDFVRLRCRLLKPSAGHLTALLDKTSHTQENGTFQFQNNYNRIILCLSGEKYLSKIITIINSL